MRASQWEKKFRPKRIKQTLRQSASQASARGPGLRRNVDFSLEREAVQDIFDSVSRLRMYLELRDPR